MKKQMNIAIDGPAGAGKSTVAKLVAEALNYVYIDTGAMYRALTYEALKRKIDIHQNAPLLTLLKELSINFENHPKGQLIYVNGNDVTEEIRSTEVTNHVSYVAAHKEIRKEMVSRQQSLADRGGTVMDGRDIGTYVLPNADVKVFLTASVNERAKRRHEQNIANGQTSDLDILREEIRKRDQLDSERETAPLKKADDAIEIDSTSLSIEKVVEKILDLVAERREQSRE